MAGFPPWAIAMVLLGLGTALVYLTLLPAGSDVAHPDWCASAVGVYRLWRDGGCALGAQLAGEAGLGKTRLAREALDLSR